MCTYLHACFHAYIHIHIQADWLHLPQQFPGEAHTYINTYMHTYMHIYKQAPYIRLSHVLGRPTHTYTHTCTYTSRLPPSASAMSWGGAGGVSKGSPSHGNGPSPSVSAASWGGGGSRPVVKPEAIDEAERTVSILYHKAAEADRYVFFGVCMPVHVCMYMPKPKLFEKSFGFVLSYQGC